MSVEQLVRDGRVTELPGIGKTLETKLQTLDRDRGHDAVAEAARAVPERADRDDAPPRLRPQARAPALRRAGHRLARQAARGGRGPAAARACAGSAPRRRRSCSRRSPPATTARRRRAGCSRARWPSPSSSPRRCARRPAPTASRSPARCGRSADAVKDLDIVATTADPAGARRSARRARRSSSPSQRRATAGARVVLHAGMSGRPQGRRARPVRQRAAALHRLQGPQRGAARGGRAARAARLGVRDPRRRRRRDAALRDRGGRSTSGSACRGSRPSCARAAASSRPPRRARCPSSSTLEDLRGDLHSHTTLSDGTRTSRQMVEGARATRLRVPRDHRPLGDARVRQPRRRRTRCARRSSACARSTRSSTASSC